MLHTLLRRAAALVMILALVAGVQMRVMPMAMGSPATAMAGMASDGGGGGCKGCLPGKAAVSDCGVLCAALVAVVDVTPSLFRSAAPSAWAWSSDLTRSRSCAPDTAPPRS
jgi:hypothetical protein